MSHFAQYRKKAGFLDEEDWKDFALGNDESDLESTPRKSDKSPRKQYNGRSSILDTMSDTGTEELSDEEDDVKNKTLASSTSRCFYEKIESWTKLFTFLLHTRLCLNKNYLLATRNKFQLAYLTLTPILLLMLVRWFTSLSNDFTQLKVLNPQVNHLDHIEKCYHPTDPCITVAYGIIGDKEDNKGEYSWIHNTMQHLAEENGLAYGSDVKMISLGPSYDFKEYIENHRNRTLFGVLF